MGQRPSGGILVSCRHPLVGLSLTPGRGRSSSDDGAAPKVPFLKIYKYTISGYALNYVTRWDFLGGEPYRIMELTPYVGGQGDIQRDSVCHDAHLFPFLFLDFLHPPLLVALWPGNVGRNGGVHGRLFRLLRYGHLLFPERI